MTESDNTDKRKSSYQVNIKPFAGRVRAYYGERELADSTNAVLLEETRHTPVYYFPEADVRMDWLHSNAHSTHCPFKGQACYWNLNVDGILDKNLAWAYQDPIAEAAAIKGHISFYTDRVNIRITD